ncbi:MAG: hypothetical protein K5675_02645 [Lachnospiraceae bacterium]|nr:hypothetical protein [Lachnospiraceae bacterium]
MATEREKTDRFKRVAEKRTNRIIEQIRLLGNCANKSNYQYSDEDVEKIFFAIEKELRETKAKYKVIEQGKLFEL